jgi:molybdate transport system permease protein
MTRRRRVGAGVPALLVPPAVIGAAFLLLPTVALLIRMPWSGLRRLYGDSDVSAALTLSLETATAATVASLLLGVPLAWMLARLRFRGLGLVRAAVTMPLVLPPVVGGVALFLALGRLGVLGRYLDEWFGFTLPFTKYGVVVAEAFVAMPFLVVTVEGALRASDRRLEEAATTLGASRLTVLRRITLPSIGPSLMAGTVLCWARALGEFGATVTFNGALAGKTEVMPILISDKLYESTEATEALSLVLIAIALVILFALREQWLHPAVRT